MAISQYRNTMRAGILGAVVDMVPASFISRNVEDVAGIGFGRAVFQGTTDEGITATATAGKFVGITVRDNGVVGIAETGNGFRQRDSARLMTEGSIWLTAAVAVSARDAVYVVAATGAFTNDAGSAPANIPLAGWQWDSSTTAANQLARARRI